MEKGGAAEHEKHTFACMDAASILPWMLLEN